MAERPMTQDEIADMRAELARPMVPPAHRDWPAWLRFLPGHNPNAYACQNAAKAWEADLAELAALRARVAELEAEAGRLRAENATLRDGPTDAPAIPDGEPWPVVLGYVEWCARSWMPGVRLLGNARAQDIARACREVIDAYGLPPDPDAPAEGQP